MRSVLVHTLGRGGSNYHHHMTTCGWSTTHHRMERVDGPPTCLWCVVGKSSPSP